jgi:hypothetical protein
MAQLRFWTLRRFPIPILDSAQKSRSLSDLPCYRELSSLAVLNAPAERKMALGLPAEFASRSATHSYRRATEGSTFIAFRAGK